MRFLNTENLKSQNTTSSFYSILRCLKFTFLYILFFQICNAQTNSTAKLNALSVELGKNGYIANVSFDKTLRENQLGLRLFAGSNFNRYLNAKSFGIGLYHLEGKEKNFAEFGLDAGYFSIIENSDDQKSNGPLFPDYPINTYLINFNLGYRNYTKNGLFRIGVSPGIIKDGFVPGGYISYGLRF